MFQFIFSSREGNWNADRRKVNSHFRQSIIAWFSRRIEETIPRPQAHSGRGRTRANTKDRRGNDGQTQGNRTRNQARTPSSAANLTERMDAECRIGDGGLGFGRLAEGVGRCANDSVRTGRQEVGAAGKFAGQNPILSSDPSVSLGFRRNFEFPARSRDDGRGCGRL